MTARWVRQDLIVVTIAIAGVFGTVTSVLAITDIFSPGAYISHLMMSLYSCYFGLIVLMFELSNSPKVNRCGNAEVLCLLSCQIHYE